MSTHVPGFQSLSASLHHFVLAKSATSGITAKFNACGWLPRGGEAVKGFSFVVYSGAWRKKRRYKLYYNRPLFKQCRCADAVVLVEAS